MGAAIQGGVLSGDVKDVLLLDVTPLTLGIETMGGVMTKLIERNTTIPHKSLRYSQQLQITKLRLKSLFFRVKEKWLQITTSLQDLHCKISRLLSRCTQVKVTFDIDANGILSVSAKDLGTGKEQSIKVEAATKIDENEIERMVNEAEANKDADKKKREAVGAHNQLDSLIFTAEKSLKDGDKVPAEMKSDIEAEIASAKEKLSSEDVDAINAAKSSLEQKTHKLAELLYQQAGAGQQGADAASGQANAQQTQDADDVVDAEFE